MKITDFSHTSPAHRLVFGWGARAALKEELGRLDVRRPMLACSTRAARDELAAAGELIQEANVGLSPRTPEDAIAAVRALAQRAGLPSRLRDANVSREKLPPLAQVILNEPGLAFNPRPVESAAQIAAILDSVW